MKILALVTARKNSKRLPKKNIKILGKKTLIEWTISSAKKINEICDILVSTDDKKVFNIAKKQGALVPWMRPKKLSKDNSSSVEVTIHALDWYEKNVQKVDGILLLQPTSPYRNKKNIKMGLKLFKKNSFKKILGVSLLKNNPFLSFCIKKNRLKKITKSLIKINYKKEKLFYYINGSFYLISPKELRKTKSFFKEPALPLIIGSKKEAIDIDDAWDFKIAQKTLNLR
tara:strand:- start:103 stop:786 length:684 start_codon:yes stop_codon:yes gene_type:complete